MINLKSAVIVVTGASAGVGRAVVREFAKRRSKIALLARGLDGLEEARKDVEKEKGIALVLPTDVADPQQVFNAGERAEKELGPIDIWINNAMTTVFSPFKEITPAEYKRATEVTYLGTVYGTMCALRYMIPRNRGVIVQVGSALAYRAIPLQAPYCGAKHAIRGFTDSIRSELIHDRSNIHITMVQLPAVNTPQFDWCKSKMPRKPQPVPPIYQPELSAKAVVWAATHRRREFLVGFPTFKAVIGNKFFPAFADRVLASQAYSGQQTNEPLPKNRPFNLFHPVPGDHGAHGSFDAHAMNFSLQLWLNMHRYIFYGLILAAFLMAVYLAVRMVQFF